MSSAATGTTAETYSVDRTDTVAESRAESKEKTYADTLTATESVAQFIGRDLAYLVTAAHVDLAKQLTPPKLRDSPDALRLDNTTAMECLKHDLERMLRKHYVKAVHLILSDETPNANNQKRVRYLAHYEVNYQAASVAQGHWGGIIKASQQALAQAEFSLVIAWRAGLAREKKLSVRPHEYFFTWVPDTRNFDRTGLVRYRFGGVRTNSIQVSRIEYYRLKHIA